MCAQAVLSDSSPGKYVLRMETRFEKARLPRSLLRILLKYTLGVVNLVYYPFNRRRQCLHDRLTGSRVFKKPCRLRWLTASSPAT